MKTVCVFPGQGSQHRGMGQALFERYPELVAQASDCLGYSLRELCLEDPDRLLARTDHTQPALYVVGALAYLDRLAQGHPVPDFVAGHSLGEYCAVFAAGGFDLITGLQLVKKRGELMNRAPKGGMAAVLNVDQRAIERILAGLPYRNIDIANINSRQQCILSGLYDEVHADDLKAAFSEAGGAVIPLNVSAAFHSRCMTQVEAEFGDFLAGFRFNDLKVPVVANCTARPYPVRGYLDLLRRQISSPVRWYESVSWLLRRGCSQFTELGAGDVLKKLHLKIVQDPMELPADAPVAPVAETPAAAPAVLPAAALLPQATAPAMPAQGHRLVFMYAGQGSQYHRMGKELYDTHPAFRQAMDQCAEAYRSLSGRPLLDTLYRGPAKSEPFVHLQDSHAALFSIGHALTEALRADGFEPQAVLGHSLGEYIAAAVAGALDWRDALKLVLQQASLLQPMVGQGGLLSVLGDPQLFDQRPDAFGELALAGVNYRGNFLVSGRREALARAQSRLETEGIVCIRLPVSAAFHSPELDLYRDAFIATARSVTIHRPRLPMYSAASAARLDNAWLEDHGTHMWRVVRDAIRYDRLMDNAFAYAEASRTYFVDLSASGSFANFLKYGYAGRYRCKSAINQFGNDKASMDALAAELRALA